MTGECAPTPDDNHAECGHAAVDRGAVALICHVAHRVTRADISFYATAEQAVSAAGHCRAPGAVGHQLMYRDGAGRLRARTWTTPHPAPPTDKEPSNDHQ